MSKKILVVDDEPDSLSLINDFLVHGGYETILCESGYDALEIIPCQKPCLVILDVIMPEINGLDVLRKIRQNPEIKKMPVVMVSALGPGIKLMLDQNEQADYYLSKPFSGKELLRIIGKILSQSDNVVCWVNYNVIRKEARVHLADCIYCNPNGASTKANWVQYSSLEVAKTDQKTNHKDYSWSTCKVCLPDNKKRE